MQAGNALALAAATLNNEASGEIKAADLRLSGSNLTNRGLTNRGLIDGAETIDGLTSAPVIAARSRLDLGATTIENREHALLFSAGDLAIGGALDGTHIAIGQAGALNNTSASIEALGNLGIDAAQINNANAHFSTQVVDLGNTSITECQGNGAATRYLADTPGVWIYNDESDHLHTLEGNYSRWTAYRYTRSTTETQVLSSDTGNLTSYWRHHRDGRDNTGSSTIAYAPPATPVPGDPSRPVARIVEAPAVSSPGTSGPGVSVPAVSSPGTSGPALLIRTITPNITLPDNHLFHRPSDPAAHYFVETDPRFADYRSWISSDYLLQQLNLDPALTQKRLGDGFYEQRLLREQLAQLTGRRFLDGYASDEAQYQALMDAGVSVAKAWHLIPGVALSAEQMAQLTSDIVWLVEQDIRLADGRVEKALVPQIYARVRPDDLTPSGSLIAADRIDLALSGDLTNAGTIAGRQLVSLTRL